MKTNQVIRDLLLAREERTFRKLALAGQGWHVVSLQLNIPGYPKHNELTELFMARVDERFERFLTAHLLRAYRNEKKAFVDKAGDCRFYLVPDRGITSERLKALTEQFEQEHPLGRIIDLDVLDSKGHPVSSGKAKSCFICKQPAEVCRKALNHSIDEVREAMMKAMQQFVDRECLKNVVDDCAAYAVKSLLYEVSLSPKPGLVCRSSSGAHTDMDFITFMASIAALSPYFREVGELALRFSGQDYASCLPMIRAIGLKMERKMFAATYGVNTHKGAVFILALSVFAAVRVAMKKKGFRVALFASVIQQVCKGMIQRELCCLAPGEARTHGEACFMNYGLQGAGARAEAEQGMPTVLHHVLPFIDDNNLSLADLDGGTIYSRLVPVLLKIMSVNNDTNVLFRHGDKVLETLKCQSKEVLDEFMSGRETGYLQLVEWCNTHKISPGGSADLLSLTVFICSCQTQKSWMV